MTLDDLTRRLETESALRCIAIRIRRVPRANVERLIIERSFGVESRYIEYEMIDEPAVAWTYRLLFGSCNNTNAGDDTDGRRAGDLDYAVEFGRRWLLDHVSLQELPAPPAPFTST